MQAQKLKILQEGEIGYGIIIEQGGTGYVNRSLNEHIIVEEIKKAPEKAFDQDLFMVLQRADVINENNRIYGRDILERECEKLVKKVIPLNSLYVEVNHPNETAIDMKNIGMMINDIWWKGNTVMGKGKLVLSPKFLSDLDIQVVGDIIANIMFFYNGTISISSRGVGSTKQKNDKIYVGNDFDLITWDIVNVPSTFYAHLRAKEEFANKDADRIKAEIKTSANPSNTQVKKTVNRFAELNKYLSRFE
jgi:hypothetical protein